MDNVYEYVASQRQKRFQSDGSSNSKETTSTSDTSTTENKNTSNESENSNQDDDMQSENNMSPLCGEQDLEKPNLADLSRWLLEESGSGDKDVLDSDDVSADSLSSKHLIIQHVDKDGTLTEAIYAPVSSDEEQVSSGGPGDVQLIDVPKQMESGSPGDAQLVDKQQQQTEPGSQGDVQSENEQQRMESGSQGYIQSVGVPLEMESGGPGDYVQLMDVSPPNEACSHSVSPHNESCSQGDAESKNVPPWMELGCHGGFQSIPPQVELSCHTVSQSMACLELSQHKTESGMSQITEGIDVKLGHANTQQKEHEERPDDEADKDEGNMIDACKNYNKDDIKISECNKANIEKQENSAVEMIEADVMLDGSTNECLRFDCQLPVLQDQGEQYFDEISSNLPASYKRKRRIESTPSKEVLDKLKDSKRRREFKTENQEVESSTTVKEELAMDEGENIGSEDDFDKEIEELCMKLVDAVSDKLFDDVNGILDDDCEIKLGTDSLELVNKDIKLLDKEIEHFSEGELSGSNLFDSDIDIECNNLELNTPVQSSSPLKETEKHSEETEACGELNGNNKPVQLPLSQCFNSSPILDNFQSTPIKELSVCIPKLPEGTTSPMLLSQLSPLTGKERRKRKSTEKYKQYCLEVSFRKKVGSLASSSDSEYDSAPNKTCKKLSLFPSKQLTKRLERVKNDKTKFMENFETRKDISLERTGENCENSIVVSDSDDENVETNNETSYYKGANNQNKKSQRNCTGHSISSSSEGENSYVDGIQSLNTSHVGAIRNVGVSEKVTSPYQKDGDVSDHNNNGLDISGVVDTEVDNGGQVDVEVDHQVDISGQIEDVWADFDENAGFEADLDVEDQTELTASNKVKRLSIHIHMRNLNETKVY